MTSNDPPAYLDSHPQVLRQRRSGRRGHPNGHKVTGCIVVHTAESFLDEIGEDSGAEDVVDWMTRRTTYGSYHDLSDSDSTVHAVSYGDEAYHDGTGSNRYTIGQSFALRTTDWATMGADRLGRVIEQGAQSCARAARYVFDTEGIRVPARRISAAQCTAGLPGFTTHAERDPGRRSDPGADFPWGLFLDRFAELITDPNHPAPGAQDMPLDQADLMRIAEGTGIMLDRRLDPDGKGNLLVRIRNSVAQQERWNRESVIALREILRTDVPGATDTEVTRLLTELLARAPDQSELVDALDVAGSDTITAGLAAVEASLVADPEIQP